MSLHSHQGRNEAFTTEKAERKKWKDERVFKCLGCCWSVHQTSAKIWTFLNTSNIFSLSTEKFCSSSQSLCAHIRTGKGRLLTAQTFKHRVFSEWWSVHQTSAKFRQFQREEDVNVCWLQQSQQHEPAERTVLTDDFQQLLCELLRSDVTPSQLLVFLSWWGENCWPGFRTRIRATCCCCHSPLLLKASHVLLPPKDFYRNSRFPTSLKV